MESLRKASSELGWRPALRSVLLGVPLLGGGAWVGLLSIVVATYVVMSRSFLVAVDWDLGRWNRWGFDGHAERTAGMVHVVGIWWIILPVVVLCAIIAGVRLPKR